MPQVLTTNAVITCPHQGRGISIPSSTKWLVNGGLVLIDGDGGTIAGCGLTTLPCTRYTLSSMGLNASQIDGRQVMLVTDFNKTDTGMPLRMSETHTTIDDSTPAPIPPGQPAPPLAPELTDVVPPTVLAAPKVLAFTIAAPVPALVVTFTLTGAHPRQWILMLLNEPLKTHADMTNGAPPGLVVAPAGGAWSTPSLTVTVTMTAAFMAALTPGPHHLFLAGVSQRGLQGSDEAILTVS